jgi:hypothetical protein
VRQTWGVSELRTARVVQNRIFVFLCDYRSKTESSTTGGPNERKIRRRTTHNRKIVLHVHAAPFPEKEQMHLDLHIRPREKVLFDHPASKSYSVTFWNVDRSAV